MKNEPIRVAHVIGKWVGGGVEAVVMNYYRHIDRTKIQFDFICDDDSINIPYEEIEKLGGKVIIISPYQKVIKYHKSLKKVLKDGNYKIVHSHINTLSVFSLFAAKCAKVPVRIAHSHSTTNKKEKKKNILKILLRPFSKLFANNYMCCSEMAGRWLFGNNVYNEGNVFLLNNAIDIDKFKYNEDIRIQKRKELGIGENQFVIGCICRLVESKNCEFLINLFNEYKKNNYNSKLIIIGQGPLYEKLEKLTFELNINEDVLFLGQKEDIYNYYNVFDIYVMPSLYEGLGMVYIEAQINGLPCLASNYVVKAVEISNHIYFLELEHGYDKWVETIKKFEYFERNSMFNEKKELYDIKKEGKKLENYYIDKMEEIVR